MDRKRLPRYFGYLIAGVILFLIVFNKSNCYTPDVIAYDYASIRGLCNATIIYVDFGEHSGTNRLYIYDIPNQKILYKCKVLNGKGGNNKFSNKIGSNCSSLGLYKVLEESIMSNGCKCIRLRGMSSTNSNALKRGIVIHPSTLASCMPFQFPGNFPLTNASKGCFSVSFKDFSQITEIIRNKKEVYLYAFH